MAKIAFVNMEAFGHVNPTLPVVKELTDLGHEVLYYVPESFRKYVEAVGAKLRPYSSSMTAKLSQPVPVQPKPGEFADMLLKETSHTLPQLLTMLSEDRPDVVVFDFFCIAARYAAKKLSIPWVRLCPTYPSNESYSLFEREDLSQADSEIKKVIDQHLHDLRDNFDVEIKDCYDELMRVDSLNVVFLPQSFHPHGETFDERFVFTGPCIIPATGGGSIPPSFLEGKKRLYISLGTVFNHWPEFFSMCFEAFKDSEWNVILSYGSRIDPNNLGPIPSNFFAGSHISQLEVLQHVDVFVTHGGMNSTMESLYYEVPMVVIPQMPEQSVTSHRIADLELGVRFDRGEVTAASLRQAVEKLYDDAEIKNRLKKISQTCRDAGGYKKAAASIERAAN